MNMAGKIRDKNETMDMDQLFSASIYATLDWKHGFVKFCGYCFRISTS